MQVLDPNNVKIYNLSSGKSVPEWLSDRKRRLLLKKNVDLRRRIALIQDFEMPAVSSAVRLSPDGQYVIATGIYKPRVRCFDVNNLAMKFERCFDSEVITFEILSEDYSKMVFLQCDRYVEFHSAEGRYYRLRIPKFGRDMKYQLFTCDLYMVGDSSDIYRLNLERGQFMPSLTSAHSTEINKIAINQDHGLVLTGGSSGKLESWDPRTGTCIGSLDCAFSCLMDKGRSCVERVPSITALNFKNSLTYGVGMSTGQILLYDIRNNKPYRMKDHMYELPIKDVKFLNDYVLSMDESIVKLWNEETGGLFTSIDAGSSTSFNNLCVVPNSGMLFIANESTKIQTYYIPNLGPAPKWCGFLDALTEELEEKSTETMYDDYKFVTDKELEDLGLSHLIGSDLLRAYMHGYFMDVRLYRKAKSVIEPFDFEKYKSKKIKEKLDEEKANRVRIQKPLPSVNKDLAIKLMEDKAKRNKRSKGADNLLKDDRFKALFENPEFEVDPNAEEYRLLTPALKRLDARTKESYEQENKSQPFVLEDSQINSSSSEESSDDDSNTKDDEIEPVTKKSARSVLKKGINKAKSDKRNLRRHVEEIQAPNTSKRTKYYELSSGQELKMFGSNQTEYLEDQKRPLGERVEERVEDEVEVLPFGNRSYSFVPSEKKRNTKKMKNEERHRKERRKSIRPAPKSGRSKFR